MNEIIQRPEFIESSSAIEKFRGRAMALQIVDAPTRDMAVTLLGEIKRVSKGLKAFKDTLFKPIKDHIKSMESFLKPHENDLDQFAYGTEKRILAYDVEQKRIANETWLAEQSEIRRKAMEDAERVKRENPSAPPPPAPVYIAPPVHEKTARTFEGVVSTTKSTWKGRVIDFSALPDEYKEANESKINAVIKANPQIKIPGVENYEHQYLSTRT